MILLSNINSIPSNLDKFLLYTGISKSNDIDIVEFCETRLTQDIEQLYKWEGYSMFTINRNRYGSGVCLYVKEQIASIVRNDICLMDENIETLFIEAAYQHTHVLVGVIYRRRNANLCQFLSMPEKILRDLAITGKACVILGDFNINLLQDSQRCVRSFTDLHSFGYYPCITKPTRAIRGSATIIDHVWTNCPEIIAYSGI